MIEQFITKNFRKESLDLIATADSIINEYQTQGYTLTLRQLYYQFVARDVISNTDRSYKRLGKLVNDARLAGLLSWQAIEDRTRNLKRLFHWRNPANAMEHLINQYHIDLWANQPFRVEVWIEKEALAGVIDSVCSQLDVPYFACRGYVSQSEQWKAYKRSLNQDLVILHLGDHDPSGIDMTRDNDVRLNQVFGGDVYIERLALNLDQVNDYNLPPNPAKTTDTRFKEYLSKYGGKSWELDALQPQVINDLIVNAVKQYRDDGLWQSAIERQEFERTKLEEAAVGLAA